MRAGGNRVFGAPEIRYQYRDDQVRDRQRVAYHVGSIRHLRQQFGRDEGANFDLPATGRRLRADPALFDCRRQYRVDTLQAVARANLTDEYVDVFHDDEISSAPIVM